MEVEYENVPEDIQYMTRVMPWWTIAEFMLTAPGSVLLAAAPATLILLSTGHFAFGGVLLLAALLFAGRYLWQILHYFRKIPVKPGRILMRITPDYVEVEHPEYRSRQAWEYLTSVQRVAGAIVLQRPMNRANIIPDREFDSPDSAERFYQLAQAYHAAAFAQPAVDLAEKIETFLPDWTQDLRYSVLYQNTIAELVNMVIPTATQPRTTASGYLGSIFSCGVANVVLAYFAGSTNGIGRPPILLDPWLESSLLAFVTLLVVVINFSTFYKLRELINRWRISTTALLPKTIEIGPQGTLVSTPLVIIAIRWSALDQIVHNADAIYISDTLPAVAYVIPKSAFPDPSAAEQFAEEMVEWYRASINAIDVGRDHDVIEAELANGDNPYRSPRS